MGGATLTGGFNGGFDGDGGLGRDGGLGLGGATKKRSRGPQGHSTLCVGFAASGCLAGVEVVVAWLLRQQAGGVGALERPA